jgi:hypothetical protein
MSPVATKDVASAFPIACGVIERCCGVSPGAGMSGVFVTLRACPGPLRNLTLGYNTRIWQSASQENARRELSRA